MRQILIIGLLSLSFSMGNSQTEEPSEQANFNSKSPELNNVLKKFETLSKEIDMIYEKDSTKIELFLQIDTNSIITRVSNYDNTPESLHASYNLCRDNSGKIIFIAEYPFSESGDWDLTYENYFDEAGNLIAFIRKCNFFNGICAEIVHERSVYYYDSSHKLIKKTYEIRDQDKKPLDAKKCLFNYAYSYKKYMTLKEYFKNYPFEKV